MSFKMLCFMSDANQRKKVPEVGSSVLSINRL